MRLKTKTFMVCLGILGTAFLFSGCHKQKVTAAPPPPPTPAPAPPAAPTGTLTAEPATVEKGHSVTLSWTSENATSLDLEPGVGEVQASGSTTATPSDSTTYVLTLKGPGGHDTKTARVTVIAPPPAPPPAAAPSEVTEEQAFGREVKDAYFDYDKSDIRPDAQQTLTADADFFKAHPGISFTVEGHCDERGSEEYNLGLGDRRATSAKNFLVNLGIPADRIFTISYGKDRPQCAERSEDCWQRNRRAAFKMGRESR